MNLLIIFMGFLRIFYWITRPFYFLRSLSSKKKIPSIRSRYLHMSAVNLAKKIRYGEVKSRDVVDAFIERIKEVNPIINAVVDERFKAAQEEADQVDDFIAANNNSLDVIEKSKPLLGVPFTVKESCAVKGMSLSVGCLPLKGKTATEDGAAVSEMKKAGAIILCITNTPEMCVFWETDNLVTGCTKNPYNTLRTSGGSSGGEAALITSGGSVFGIASDTGGSIRIPAMWNGVFGHKPSEGIVSSKGHFPMTTDPTALKFVAIGAISRYAEDLPLLLKVLAADRASTLNLDDTVDLSKIKVYFMEQSLNAWYEHPVAAEIKAIIKEAASYLKSEQNCEIEKAPFPELSNSSAIAFALLTNKLRQYDLFEYHLYERKKKLYSIIELIKAFFGLSEYSLFGLLAHTLSRRSLFTKRRFSEIVKENEALETKFQDVLKDNAVFLYPTYPIPAVMHNECFWVACAAAYSVSANTMGLPATTVPMGLNKNGLPIGLQVIAGKNQDRLCLAVAKALEEKFGGWVPPS